jgi:hypothetical protein
VKQLSVFRNDEQRAMVQPTVLVMILSSCLVPPMHSGVKCFEHPGRTNARTKPPRRLANPYGIVVDGEGNVLIGDYANKRVAMFRSDGAFVRSIGYSPFLLHPPCWRRSSAYAPTHAHSQTYTSTHLLVLVFLLRHHVLSDAFFFFLTLMSHVLVLRFAGSLSQLRRVDAVQVGRPARVGARRRRTLVDHRHHHGQSSGFQVSDRHERHKDIAAHDQAGCVSVRAEKHNHHNLPLGSKLVFNFFSFWLICTRMLMFRARRVDILDDARIMIDDLRLASILDLEHMFVLK